MLNSFYTNRSERKTCMLLLLFLALVLLLVSLIDDAVNLPNFVSHDYSVWNKGWQVVNSDGNSAQKTLPQTMHYGSGVVTIARVLDERVEDTGAVLRIGSKYENVSVSLNGQVLYSYPNEDSLMSGMTGTTFHYVQLPEGAVGQELSIRYTFQSNRTPFYEISAPEFAEKETFISRSILSSIPLLLIAVVAVIAGLAIWMFTIRMKANQRLSDTFWNIGVFALLFAGFLFSRLPYIPFLIKNPLTIHFLTYATLLTMPIPFVSIFTAATEEKYRKFQILAILLNFLNVVGQTALASLHVADFRDLLPLTFALVAFSMVTVLVGIYKSKTDENDRPWGNDTTVLVTVGSLLDLLLVFIGHSSPNSCLFFAIGTVLFLMTQVSYFTVTYSGQWRNDVETMLLEEMAYSDMLTGIRNRNAYEKYLEDITARPPADRMYGLIADINDLKYTNDNFGHEMGDAIIITVSSILSEVFGKNGQCFRLGGDEFVAFIRGVSEEQMEQHIADFKAKLDAYNQDHFPAIQVALGYAETEPDDYRNMKDFLRRIDKMMYEDKRFSKTLNHQYRKGAPIPTDAEIEARVESSRVITAGDEALGENEPEEPSADNTENNP